MPKFQKTKIRKKFHKTDFLFNQMIISVQIENRRFEINAENPLSIAIPLDFDGKQPNAYGVEKAVSKAYETGGLIGDTRRGGSCNFEQITFIPHCSGTHTECAGHLTNERISVHDCLREAFLSAILISVNPEKSAQTDERYSIELGEKDRLITGKSLQTALKNAPFAKPQALIIRTLPNDESKLSKTYLEEIPPFFTIEAMEFIGALGASHLLADVPSIDRIFDEGKLANHRIFWNIKQGSFEIGQESLPKKTITEMIYVPDQIKDGAYLLNLQIAPFAADAAPSRPILFELVKN